ncbi:MULTISPECIES: ArsR/SmtB family transcription factor [Pseudomonadota]|jgi:DNA-binding transcriptional ArsR family regulator|uniref:ArsR/SmtB family transcription factor n=1 Tax=Pseudomonadota TaxID=1224 RepID=UPI000C3E66F5|nr:MULTISPECIES: metalloregulator ArsR/SmtB family transcription factor [Pseudomonadota]MAG80376.1 transcriptional regulator [Sutterellaceae bacterium]|tara:strand:- start:15 stop:377 length:363 start_codon:yes stop_codon:yes gene_type:complete
MKRHNEEILAKQLGALAHPARLAAIRQLTAAGPVGLSAGKLGERVGMAPSALTFHLQKLAYAGLVTSRKEGQFVYYCAAFESLLSLTDHLVGACCRESSERCGPRCPTAADSAGDNEAGH